MIPTIELEVYKEGSIIESIILEGKSLFVFGCNPNKANVILMHASISRCHAALIIDKKIGAMIIDLLSKASTTLNGEKLIGLVGRSIKIGDQIQFGQSTRTYLVKNIDYSKMQKAFEKEAQDLER